MESFAGHNPASTAGSFPSLSDSSSIAYLGGSNPEIETQYVYKIEILKNNSFLVSEMNTNFNDKSCIFQNKILVFGVL